MRRVVITLLLCIFAFEVVFSITPPHFQKVWTNNPWQPMSIIVTSATLDGLNLGVGDEIAVFDIETSTGNQICVGVIVLTSSTGPFIITASTDDPTTPVIQDGFIPGHQIIFRYWDVSKAEETVLINATFDPGFNQVYTSLGTASVVLEGFSVLTWTGIVNDSWDNAGNWDFGLIPSLLIKVNIPSTPVGGNFPRIYSNDAQCKYLSVNPGASLIISGHLRTGE